MENTKHLLFKSVIINLFCWLCCFRSTPLGIYLYLKWPFQIFFWVFIPAFYSLLESSHTVRQSTLIPLPALMVFRIENKFNFSACTWTKILNSSSRLKIKNKSAPPCHPHQSYFSEVTTTIYSSGNCLCHSRLPAAVSWFVI